MFLLYFSPGHLSLYKIKNIIFGFIFSFNFKVNRTHSQVVIQIFCLYLCFWRTTSNGMIFSNFFNVVLKVWSDRSRCPFIINDNVVYDTVTLWHYDTMTLWHCDIMTLWHYDTVTLWHYDTPRFPGSIIPDVNVWLTPLFLFTSLHNFIWLKTMGNAEILPFQMQILKF